MSLISNPTTRKLFPTEMKSLKATFTESGYFRFEVTNLVNHHLTIAENILLYHHYHLDEL